MNASPPSGQNVPSPLVGWSLGATAALTMVVLLATDPDAEVSARPGPDTVHHAATPAEASAPGAGRAPSAERLARASAPSGARLAVGAEAAWPDPGFVAARADPFQERPVDRLKPVAPVHVAVLPPPGVMSSEVVPAVPAPAPPRWRLLGRVRGLDGITTVYLASDAPAPSDRPPQAVHIGLVLGGGYRVESVDERHVGLLEPQSETRARIELPDWPQSPGLAGGSR